LLVVFELQFLEGDRGPQQRNAAARYDTFLDRGASGM